MIIIDILLINGTKHDKLKQNTHICTNAFYVCFILFSYFIYTFVYKLLLLCRHLPDHDQRTCHQHDSDRKTDKCIFHKSGDQISNE